MNMGILKIKHAATVEGKLNTNGHRNKEGNIVEFRILWLK